MLPRKGFLIALTVLLVAPTCSGRAATEGARGRAARDAEGPVSAASRPLRAAAQEPGRGSSRPSGLDSQQPSEGAQGPLPVFEFHSGFWINLHHFLYQQARLRKNPTPPTTRPSASGQADADNLKAAVAGPEASLEVSTDGLTPQERKAWAGALDYYGEHLADRDLLFNGDMVNINNRLAEMEACTDLSGQSSRECASGLRKELESALEDAAPVYRARWWAKHDRDNRSWIAAVGPMVRQLGGTLAQKLAATYQAGWPAGRLRVDVVHYGGPFGAYTTLDPVHLTISSADARNQGPAALEVLFHEASHALAGSVRDAIVRECRARGKPIPRDLWHALLFYTTGEMVKRALGTAAGRTLTAADSTPSPPTSAAEPGRAAAASSAYTPYAYRYGLYARGWQGYQRVLERYWQPYLDGKTEFDTAMARLVTAL